MRRDNLKKEIMNIIDNKKFLNIVAIALVIAFILLAISFLSTGDEKKSSSTPASANNMKESSGENPQNQEVLDYEKSQEKQVETILKKMEGVGEVEVMIYFESGEKKVPAVDSNSQLSKTQETDNNGGNRVTDQQIDGSTVVMTGSGSETEPFILQTYKPQITGVFIVAEGAENAKTKYDIQTAISNLFGITLDKVNVYPMKN